MINTQKLNTVLLLLVALLGVMALIFSLVALAGIQAIKSELSKASSGVPAPDSIIETIDETFINEAIDRGSSDSFEGEGEAEQDSGPRYDIEDLSTGEEI